ncbi:MAG: cell division protein FtsH, partial [Actinobacteria bacterium]|nr:cell division protein FtsH [Actinomycetota bacterium]
AKNILTEHREQLDAISDILVRRETIEKHQFEGLLTGKTEAELFAGDPAAPPAGVPPTATLDRRRDAPGPRPRPRPEAEPA